MRSACATSAGDSVNRQILIKNVRRSRCAAVSSFCPLGRRTGHHRRVGRPGRFVCGHPCARHAALRSDRPRPDDLHACGPDPHHDRPLRQPTATFGNSGRNILRGPGQFTIDAALAKFTRVASVDTEVRIEAFNLLNSPAFANPANTIGSATAGTISSLMPFTPMRQIQLGLKVRF